VTEHERHAKGWRRLWCTCGTCEDGRSFKSLDEELRTRDGRGLALRRFHRDPMPIDRLVNAAHAMRNDEDWWFHIPHNEFTNAVGAETAGEIPNAH